MKVVIYIMFMLPLISFGQQTQGWTWPSDSIEGRKLTKQMAENAYNNLKKYRKYKLIRTSNDSSILAKWINLFSYYGRERYIIKLQQSYKLKKTNDTTYLLALSPEDLDETEDEPEWIDFLFCPIGKPNGKVIAVDKNDKICECSFKNERKNGLELWYNLNLKGDTAKRMYIDDNEIKK